MIPLSMQGKRLEAANEELKRVIAATDREYRSTSEIAKRSGLTPSKVQQAITRSENQFEWIMCKKRSQSIFMWRRRV